MDITRTITSRNAAAAALGIYFGKVEDTPSVYDDLRSKRPTLDVLHDIGELHTAVERATNHMVRAAREDGASWAQIAEVLHMTKQAAHERWRHIDA